ncbi:MAG: hypothetical protein ACYCSN_16630 [Acidobacteriaceae bacterium]
MNTSTTNRAQSNNSAASTIRLTAPAGFSNQNRQETPAKQDVSGFKKECEELIAILDSQDRSIKARPFRVLLNVIKALD